MTTIKKIQNASEYCWSGIGTGGSRNAAVYGVFEDSQQVAEIRQVSGGRYMEKSKWECRNTVDREYTCFLTKQAKVAQPGELIIASGKTLREIKEKVLR